MRDLSREGGRSPRHELEETKERRTEQSLCFENIWWRQPASSLCFESMLRFPSERQSGIVFLRINDTRRMLFLVDNRLVPLRLQTGPASRLSLEILESRQSPLRVSLRGGLSPRLALDTNLRNVFFRGGGAARVRARHANCSHVC